MVLGVCGGISAYKSAELCRLLVKAGHDVSVVMTAAAKEFITPLTLQTLSGNPVGTSLFDLTQESEIGHIKLADQAALIVVAPATADVIARLAAGMADDLLSTVILASRAPVLLAPAMNVNMWENPLVQANLRRLIETGRFSTVGPDAGELACGWVGAGRLVEPQVIASAIDAATSTQGAPDLRGLRIVISAGPTYEPVDDVRFLGNRSSGRMGFALAASAARAGARVTLVAGPVSLPTPAGVNRIDVSTAQQMHQAMHEQTMQTTAEEVPHIVVMAAAVADFRPAEKSQGKLSRRDPQTLSRGIPLVANPDILASLVQAREQRRQEKRQTRPSQEPFAGPVLVGFGAEFADSPEALKTKAITKLREKACDVLILNDVGKPGIGFESRENEVTLMFADGRSQFLPRAPKDTLAQSIWTHLAPLVQTAR